MTVRLSAMKKGMLLCVGGALGGCVPASIDHDQKMQAICRAPEQQSITEHSDLPPVAEAYTPFQDQYSHRWGYRDSLGRTVVRPIYEMALTQTIQAGLDVYQSDKGWIMIDPHTTSVLASVYAFDNGPDYWEGGLRRIVENKKIGFMNQTGQIIIAPAYDWATPFFFDAGLSVVCQGCVSQTDRDGIPSRTGGVYGAIDAQGRVVVPLMYDRYEVCSGSKDGPTTLTFYHNNQPSFVYRTSTDYQIMSQPVSLP